MYRHLQFLRAFARIGIRKRFQPRVYVGAMVFVALKIDAGLQCGWPILQRAHHTIEHATLAVMPANTKPM